jgi:hypothetical protein
MHFDANTNRKAQSVLVTISKSQQTSTGTKTAEGTQETVKVVRTYLGTLSK